MDFKDLGMDFKVDFGMDFGVDFGMVFLALILRPLLGLGHKKIHLKIRKGLLM